MHIEKIEGILAVVTSRLLITVHRIMFDQLFSNNIFPMAK